MTYSPSLAKALIAAAALPLLAACTAVSAFNDATEPLDVFDLQVPAELPAASGRPQARDVIVELPTTGGALDTDRIMIRPRPLEAKYLPGVRWGEATPVMVQTLMLRTLDATGAFQYVGRRPLGTSGDYAIVTELLDFQAELMPEGDGAVIETRMISRIVRESDIAIVASRRFEARAVSPTLEDADLVAAFDAASGQMLGQFAAWTLAALGVR